MHGPLATLPRLLILAATLAPSLAMARGAPRIAEVHTVSIAQETKAPTFYARAAPRLVDGGRLVYLGHGMWKEQARMRLLEVATGKERWVEAPLAAYLASRPNDFAGLSGSGWPGFGVARLLFYDTKTGQAGLFAHDRHGSRARRRQLYLHWDLRSNKIVRHVVLGETDAQHLWYGVKPIAYHQGRGELFVQVVSGLKGASSKAGPGGGGASGAPRRRPRPRATAFEVKVVALSAAGSRPVTRWVNPRKLFPGPFVHRDKELALLVEYAELPVDHERPPRGFLVDLVKGTRRALTIPVTTYGAAISGDGKRLFAYSNQTGALWVIDLTDKHGRQLRVKRMPKRGWVLGAPGDDRYLLFGYPKGLSVIDTKRMAVARKIPRRRFGKGFFHIEGSSIAPGVVLIRNGKTLHVVRMR